MYVDDKLFAFEIVRRRFLILENPPDERGDLLPDLLRGSRERRSSSTRPSTA